MSAGIANSSEEETYKRLITEVYPTGIASVVSDTKDFWNVLTVILPNLKAEIMGRDGKLVIRPDSGDPADIICGTVSHALPKLGEFAVVTPEQKGAIEVLWDEFGGTVNSKGYKELDSHIGLIYGDSITFERAVDIIQRLEQKGFASTNVVFGVGSYTYQFNTRDTFASAMKATSAVINGEQVELSKSPKTDDGTKNSAKGRLAVFRDEVGKLYLVEHATPEQEKNSLLQPVWEDGKFVRHQSFADVRETLQTNSEQLKYILPALAGQ
jgi:nicotinamide phosphoribosyltransferase